MCLQWVMYGSSLKILCTELVGVSDWSCWGWKLSCALWQLFISQLQILALTHGPCLSPHDNWGLSSKRGLTQSPSVVSQEQGKSFKECFYPLAVLSWSCAELLTITLKRREQRVAINLRRAEPDSHPQQLVPASEEFWLNFSWTLSFASFPPNFFVLITVLNILLMTRR